jgi:hypothetical protein
MQFLLKTGMKLRINSHIYLGSDKITPSTVIVVDGISITDDSDPDIVVHVHPHGRQLNIAARILSDGLENGTFTTQPD